MKAMLFHWNWLMIGTLLITSRVQSEPESLNQNMVEVIKKNEELKRLVNSLPGSVQKLELGLLKLQLNVLPKNRIVRTSTIAARYSEDPPMQVKILVDIDADVTPLLLKQIQTVGGEVVTSVPKYNSIRARIPFGRLSGIAEDPSVRAVRRASTVIVHQNRQSLHEKILTEFQITRRDHKVTGKGVKIGVISDSVSRNEFGRIFGLRDLALSGDLPSVTVLENQSGGNDLSGEGLAMLEIIHDLAPNAELFFATGANGGAQFAANIQALTKKGCHIIVDDLLDPSSPPFQDGIIAQAVNEAVELGVQYYSSAGNFGHLQTDQSSSVWEGDFRAMKRPPPELKGILKEGYEVHDFGTNSPYLTIKKNSAYEFSLFWSDPLNQSENDYDLYLLDPNRTKIVADGTNSQAAGRVSQPYERVSLKESSLEAFDIPAGLEQLLTFNTKDYHLLVVRPEGTADRYLHVNANDGRFQRGTIGQIRGQSTAVGAFCVGSGKLNDPKRGFVLENIIVPAYSAQGPRKVFYHENGAPITPANLSSTGGINRTKPDFLGIGNWATATPGFSKFIGTSAAAPFAAAIGALLLEKKPDLTPQQARNAFKNCCLRHQPANAHTSGHGLVHLEGLLEHVAKLD